MPQAGHMTVPDLSALDSEVLERFEHGRARVLRQRLVWYCAVMLALLAISLAVGIVELFRSAAPSRMENLSPSTMLEAAGDLALGLLYGAALAYAVGWRPGRDRLVRVITWLTILASSILVVVAPMAAWLEALREGVQDASRSALSSGMMGLLSITVLHALACMMIRLTPREATRLFLPVGVVYVAAVLFLYVGDARVKAMLLLALPVAPMPGIVWTWWRFGRYRETSRTQILHGRYSELAQELALARQVHEALFPPPIERGPFRLAYRYEPRREIGGDFLFAHPLAFPPSAIDAPLSVVVIDVTGHGVSAALAVNRLHGELRRIFSEDPAGSAATVLEALNAYAYEHLAPQAMFATAICLRVEPQGALEWASAGHPAALVVRAGALARTEQLGATATMLGVLEPALFRAGARRTVLGPEDVLVALTDGAVEAADVRGRLLEIEGIVSVLEQASARGVPAAALMEAVQRHRAGAAVDDTLIVEIRRAPG